jgi:hypothetical protein
VTNRATRTFRGAPALCALAAVLAQGCQRDAPATARAHAPDAGLHPFEARLLAPPGVNAGSTAYAVVEIGARDGFHLNAEYRHQFRPDGGTAGVRFEAERYDLAPGAERISCPEAPEDTCRLMARVPFVAITAGTQQIQGVVAFSVCNPQICLIEKVPLSAAINAR